MVGIPQAVRNAGTTAYNAVTSIPRRTINAGSCAYGAVRNLPTTVSNISVSPSFSRSAIDLTASAKQHAATGNIAQRHLLASYEVAVAALAETKQGVLVTASLILDMPVNILRGNFLQAGTDIISALKAAGKTVAFVAASVVLAVAGIIFPGRAFAALNREPAEAPVVSRTPSPVASRTPSPVAEDEAPVASRTPSPVAEDEAPVASRTPTPVVDDVASRSSSPAASEEEIPVVAPTARELRAAARQSTREAAEAKALAEAKAKADAEAVA